MVSRKTAERAENGGDLRGLGKKGAQIELAGDQVADADRGGDRDGRFKKGCKPGPGRPPKTAPLEPPALPAVDGCDLFLRAMQLRDLDEAWRRLVQSYPRHVVEQLAEEAAAGGVSLPDFVIEFLHPRSA